MLRAARLEGIGDPVACHDRPYYHLILVADHIYGLAQIGSLYRDLGDEKNAVTLACNDARPYELSRQQAPVAVIKCCA